MSKMSKNGAYVTITNKIEYIQDMPCEQKPKSVVQNKNYPKMTKLNKNMTNVGLVMVMPPHNSPWQK